MSDETRLVTLNRKIGPVETDLTAFNSKQNCADEIDIQHRVLARCGAFSIQNCRDGSQITKLMLLDPRILSKS